MYSYISAVISSWTNHAVHKCVLISVIMQHLESVIKARIPGIQSLINKTIAELEGELARLGKPIAADAGVSSFEFLPVK